MSIAGDERGNAFSLLVAQQRTPVHAQQYSVRAGVQISLVRGHVYVHSVLQFLMQARSPAWQGVFSMHVRTHVMAMSRH